MTKCDKNDIGQYSIGFFIAFEVIQIYLSYIICNKPFRKSGAETQLNNEF
jgi:hypothetical protein